jgi:hypothetical protein
LEKPVDGDLRRRLAGLARDGFKGVEDLEGYSSSTCGPISATTLF